MGTAVTYPDCKSAAAVAPSLLGELFASYKNLSLGVFVLASCHSVKSAPVPAMKMGHCLMGKGWEWEWDVWCGVLSLLWRGEGSSPKGDHEL